MREGTLSPEDAAQLELPWSRGDGGGVPPDGRRHGGGRVDCVRLMSSNANSSPATPFQIPNCDSSSAVFMSAAVCITRFRTTARGSVRSTMWRSPCASFSGAASVASPSSISMCITETARRSSSSPSPCVFTFSMHQQHNYPMWKPRGSLDIGLPDGTGDATFLGELDRALPQVVAHRPECVFYLAGADPYEDDQLGGLRLTKEGLRRARPDGRQRGTRRRHTARGHPRGRLRPAGRGHRRYPCCDDRGGV